MLYCPTLYVISLILRNDLTREEQALSDPTKSDYYPITCQINTVFEHLKKDQEERKAAGEALQAKFKRELEEIAATFAEEKKVSFCYCFVTYSDVNYL